MADMKLGDAASWSCILRRLDDQGRLDHQTEACDTHALEVCAGQTVIDRKRRVE